MFVNACAFSEPRARATVLLTPGQILAPRVCTLVLFILIFLVWCHLLTSLNILWSTLYIVMLSFHASVGVWHGVSLNGGIWVWIGSNGRNIPCYINIDTIVIKFNFVFSSSEFDNKRPIQWNATTDGLRKSKYWMHSCIQITMYHQYFEGGGTALGWEM